LRVPPRYPPLREHVAVVAAGLSEVVEVGLVVLPHRQRGDHRHDPCDAGEGRDRNPVAQTLACEGAAIAGAKPPSAKPNWVPIATPEVRTLVSNCSAQSGEAAPPYPL
jgi:hypothetical protein